MKQLVTRAGRADEFEIASAAVSTEEIGNDIYPPAKRMLAAKNVPFSHQAICAGSAISSAMTLTTKSR